MKKTFLYFLLLLSIFKVVSAQDISIHEDSLHFNRYIELLEEKTDFHFFYNPQWIDSLPISINLNKATLEEVLDQLCLSKKLSYTILGDKNIVLIKNRQIKTNYAENYLQYLHDRQMLIADTIRYIYKENTEEEKSNINKEYQVFTIGNPSINSHQKKATLTGIVKDLETGEPLVGAVVYIQELKNGSATNSYGFYSVTLPKGQYKLEYRSVGMKTTYRNIIIHSNGELNVELKSTPTSLKEVIITQKSENPVRNLRMGMEKLTLKSLKQLPTGLGEPDIIKSALLLPGVQSVGEASNGFNVRGGSVDQNLILLNDAPIMNTSHFFGFFSGFNSDVIKDITLFKSGIPAKYGGRVSSVMDITMKEGNKKETKVYGGISPVSGRLTAEGPIIKDKSSFIVGARTTYSNWVLSLLNDFNIKNSKANFYDLQGNLTFDINQNNNLYLSGYLSHDKFDYYSNDAFDYNSLASTLKWGHIFSPKLFSTFSAGVSNYDYTLKSRKDSVTMYGVEYGIHQYIFKTDFSYHPSFNHKIDYGISSTWYNLAPGNRYPIGAKSLILNKTIEQEKALESAIYLSDEFDLTELISISAGFRYALYSSFGAKTRYNYKENQPKSVETITDTTYYSKGEPIQFYSGPEFRLSSNIKVGINSSLKIGINRMHQFIHMISNTTAMSPTDVWKLSDTYLKPQLGDQYSIGYYQNLRNNTIEASVETYYKKLKNVLDYKGGAQLLLNEHLETDVLNGEGKAYGIEFMVQKKNGKLTGWANYTYSRILHKIDSEFSVEKVNNGEYFPANYDKPHEFKFVSNYKFSRRLNISSNFFYSTGRPFTAPVAYFKFNDSYRVYYSERNSMRMDDYIRLDFAATLNGNLVKNKLNHSSWTFAVYNVLGRKNPYSIYFRTEGEKVQGYKMSIFGQPIYTITYNFKILGNAKDDF